MRVNYYLSDIVNWSDKLIKKLKSIGPRDAKMTFMTILGPIYNKCLKFELVWISNTPNSLTLSEIGTKSLVSDTSSCNVLNLDTIVQISNTFCGWKLNSQKFGFQTSVFQTFTVEYNYKPEKRGKGLTKNAQKHFILLLLM